MTIAIAQDRKSGFIPAGAVKVTPKCGGVEFWLYSDKNGRFCCRCFVGKAQKPTWAYWFRNEAERSQRIAQQIASIEAAQEIKAKRRKEMLAPHKWEVGLIVASSWGYDQTNVDFYEVVELIGSSMVKMEKIGSQLATDSDTGNSMAGRVVPDPEHRTGNFYRSRVMSNAAAGEYGKKASPWDGRPMYCSWYA